jgi:hypothetical protein
MRRRVFFGLLICVTFCVCVPVSKAAAPQVKSLFPRGGQVGATVEVTVSGKLAKGDQIRCDRAGVSAEVNEDGTKATIKIADSAAPGLYWLRFFNAEGAASPVPFVVGRLPEVAETEPNATPDKAQALTESSVINGKLSESVDTDIYSIKVPAGRTLVASVDANWRLGSPVDPVMQLLNENGVVLTQVDDDRGFDPLIAWPCEQETTLLVRLFGFPAAPNSTINFSSSADYVYRLTLTTDAWPDHLLPSAVQPGQEADLSIAGWNMPEALKSFTLAASPDDNLPVGPTKFAHSELAIELPLQRVAHPALTAVEPCNKEMPLQVAEKPVTVCGVIDQRDDEDSIQLTATKGEKLVFRVESRVDGHALDAVIRIFDQEGKLLTENDDAARNVFDPVAKFTAKADGPIRVSVTDRFGLGDWRYAYRLHVEPLVPTITATLKGDNFILTPGTPLEIPVTIARNDGFAEEVEFTAAVLPEGVSCEAVKSDAKGDTSKAVTLKLTTSETVTASTGAIRIVGRWGESGEVSATADLAGGQVKIENPWLTVLAPAKKEDAQPDKKEEKKE